MRITVNKFNRNRDNTLELRTLLSKDLFYFYRDYSLIDRKKYIDYLLQDIEKIEKNNFLNVIFVARDKYELVGVITLEFKEWDSLYFDVSMANIGCFKAIGSESDMIIIKRSLLKSLIKYCLGKELKRLSLRIDLMDFTSKFVLEELGFNILTVEGVKIFDKVEKIDNNGNNLKLKFRDFKKGDVIQLKKIAKDVSGLLKSHYSFDKLLQIQKTNDYYVENVINCCKGKNANKIIVAEEGGIMAGFLAYKTLPNFAKVVDISMAHAILFALSKSFRGKGISHEFFYEINRNALNSVNYLIGRVYLHNAGMVKLLSKFSGNPFFRYLYFFNKWL